MTARCVDSAPLRLAGRARREEDRRIVLGRDFRQRTLASAPSSSASACSTGRSIGEADDVARAHRAAIRFARGGSARISLGSVSWTACSISSGFPPAVQQGRDPARLQDSHVADDPRRAVAHRDADPVALCDAPRDEAVRDPSEIRSRSAKVSRSSPETTASLSPFSAQKARNNAGASLESWSTMARPFRPRR